MIERGALHGSEAIRAIRAFVSSPADVKAERNVLDEVVASINRTDGQRSGFRLELFRWERDVTPNIGASAQSVIDGQTPQYEIFIGIMAARFGTPTDGFGSGTEKEFSDAVAKRSDNGLPRILFYFDDAPTLGSDPEHVNQYSRVRAFREKMEKIGIVKAYKGVRGSEDAFYEMVSTHLRNATHEIIPILRSSDPPLSSTATLRKHLSTYVANMLTWQRVTDVDQYDLQLTAKYDSKLRPLAEVFDSVGRLVISGDPGGGKTVFQLRTFRSLCTELQARLAGSTEGAADWNVPVFVELGRFTSQRPVVELVLSHLGLPGTGEPLVALRQLLGTCSLILLFDGYNELPEDLRKQCADQIIELDQNLRAAGRHEKLKIVLTTRPHGYRSDFEPHGYGLAEIQPLTRDELKARFVRELAGFVNNPEEVFAQLGPYLRHLLSNPQHFSYALEWHQDHAHLPERQREHRSRGALLQHCISKRLQKVKPAFDSLARVALRRLAYGSDDGAVYYSDGRVQREIASALETSRSHHSVDDVVEELRRTGLLVASGDQLRFQHHSHMQFFAACEMKERWEELSRYIAGDIWHEPLVILAGLVDEGPLHELLQRTAGDAKLYAYIVANIDRPDLANSFQRKTAGAFTRQVHRLARGLGRWLVFPILLWFMSLPLLAYFFATLGDGDVSWPMQALGYAGAAICIVLLPALVVLSNKRDFDRFAEKLRSKQLPELIAVLRYLDSEGVLRQIESELRSQEAALDSFPDDPRQEFLKLALSRVRDAAQTRSYMTEDEMLDQLDDPVVMETLDPESLSDSHIDRLFAIAEESFDSQASTHAIQKLKGLFSTRAEYRSRITQLLIHLASADNSVRPVRRAALDACRALKIPLPDGAPMVAERTSRGVIKVIAAVGLAGLIVAFLCFLFLF